jgi:antirestriction protein ArdC
MKTYKDFCEHLTKELFEVIDQKGGLLEWKKSWSKEGSALLPVGGSGLYHGVNLLSLLMLQRKHGLISHRWVTFNQVRKLGGQVKKGAKATKVVYWNFIETDEAKDEEEEKQVKAICKMHSVFNLEQTTLSEEALPIFAPHVSIEALLQKHGVVISHFGGRAYYTHHDDSIVLPPQATFKSRENYYAVLLHELTHWTGNQGRLNRACMADYSTSDKARAEEELVAEIGSLFLTAYFNIDGELEQHASYVESWKTILSEREIVRAVTQATKAFAWLIGEDKATQE